MRGRPLRWRENRPTMARPSCPMGANREPALASPLSARFMKLNQSPARLQPARALSFYKGAINRPRGRHCNCCRSLASDGPSWHQGARISLARAINCTSRPAASQVEWTDQRGASKLEMDPALAVASAILQFKVTPPSPPPVQSWPKTGQRRVAKLVGAQVCSQF